MDSWSPASVEALIDKAIRLKDELSKGIDHPVLQGKNIGMVFDKSSLRTRVSFEVGINQLGAHAIVLGNSAGRLGEREPIKDFARVASRYVNGLVVRTYEEQKIIELIEHASVPVINALTDESHPCQALGDMMTLRERWGDLHGDKVLAYIGDSNNVARSLMKASEKLGLGMRVVSPQGYQFSADEKKWGEGIGITFHTDPVEGLKGVHAVYTDVWTSMGKESEKQQRLKDFADYQVNKKLMQNADKDALVLHCLPAHRGEEITDEVIEDSRAIVCDQAENRLHIQKSIMATLFTQVY